MLDCDYGIKIVIYLHIFQEKLNVALGQSVCALNFFFEVLLKMFNMISISNLFSL
jgi:hypothetical protein